MRKKVFVALRMAGIAGQEKLSGIFRFLGERSPWDVTLVRTAAEFTPARMRKALAGGYDGFVISIPGTEKTAALLADADVPTVVMDIHDPRLSARRNNVAFIRNSPEEIGKAAADHLLSMGTCRSYAFVHHPLIMEWSVDRCRQFSSVLREHGCWCTELSAPEGLGKLARPVGVLAANDDCGYELLEYCRAHRLRVPEDVAVLGINNDTLICENCHPKLSSVQPDFEQEGYLAAETLSRMMNAPRKSNNQATYQSNNQTIKQSNNLTFFVGVKAVVRRESTAEFSPAGKLVQKAIAYIRKNALAGISVDDVARHLKVSRRLADLRFRALQGTTIGETVIVFRLEEVKRLLQTTNLPIDEIAAACGYQNPNYLKNLFRKRFNMSMRDFRHQART